MELITKKLITHRQYDETHVNIWFIISVLIITISSLSPHIHYLLYNLRAQVNPQDLSNDSDFFFMTEFYSNLRLLSQELYKQTIGQK